MVEMRGLAGIRRSFIFLVVIASALVGTACTKTVVTSAVAPTTSSSPLPPAEGASLPPAQGASVASPSGPGATRDDPVPAGQSAAVGNWTIKVVGVSTNADAAIHQENMFNSKPKAGEQFAMVTVRATYTGNGSSDPFGDLTFSVIPDNGNSAHEANEVLPNDLSNSGNIPNSASAVGNVAFEVAKSDAGSLVLYIAGYDSNYNNIGAFFALK